MPPPGVPARAKCTHPRCGRYHSTRQDPGSPGRWLLRCPRFQLVVAAWTVPEARGHAANDADALPPIWCNGPGCMGQLNRRPAARRCALQYCIRCCDRDRCSASGHGRERPAGAAAPERVAPGPVEIQDVAAIFGVVSVELTVEHGPHEPAEQRACDYLLRDKKEAFTLGEMEPVDAEQLGLLDLVPGTLQGFDVAADCWRSVRMEQRIELHGARVILLRAQARLPFPMRYVAEMSDGLDACLARAVATPLQDAFQRAFSRCLWSRERVTAALAVWRTAPTPVKAAFTAAGRTDDGLWDQLARQVAVNV